MEVLSPGVFNVTPLYQGHPEDPADERCQLDKLHSVRYDERAILGWAQLATSKNLGGSYYECGRSNPRILYTQLHCNPGIPSCLFCAEPVNLPGPY